jgi:hypothetical protein
MTKFLGSTTASGVNMVTLDRSVLQTGMVQSSSATKVVIANGFFDSFTLKGTFTAFDIDGRPTASTLTSITSDSGFFGTSYVVSSFSMSVATFFGYLTAHDMATGGDGYDTIDGFTIADGIELPFLPAITGVDAAITTGTLSFASFDSDLAATVSTLGVQHAVVFTANAGQLAGHTFLVVDLDGNVGYANGGDLVIELTNANLPGFGTGNFTN